MTELKRALKSAQGDQPTGVAASELALRTELRALRGVLAEQLEPLFGAVDDESAEAAIAKYEKKRDAVLKRRLSELEKSMSDDFSKTQSGATAARRHEALAGLELTTAPLTPIFVRPQPFLIWATNPTNMLLDSYLDPVGYSWAKVAVSKATIPGLYDVSRLVFYYLWTNPSDFYAVLNATASVVLNGVCVVTGHTGIFSGGTAAVDGTARLVPLEWWNQPPTAPPPQPQQFGTGGPIFSAHAYGGGVWSLETGDLDVATLYAVSRDLRYDVFAIPPGATAVFQVQVDFNCTLFDSGSIAIDFGTREPYSIAALMQLELLTAPSMM